MTENATIIVHSGDMDKIYSALIIGNWYSMGIEAREALERSRETIANALGASPAEFIFTSGFTESSNWALKGVAQAKSGKGKHIIVSKIEDFSVLNAAKTLEKQGFKVTYLDVDGDGLVDPDHLKDSITDETILVSAQHANQEIGTVQDIKSIGEICQEKEGTFSHLRQVAPGCAGSPGGSDIHLPTHHTRSQWHWRSIYP